MQPPRFWANPPHAPGLMAHLLKPAAALFSLAGWVRQRRAQPYRAGVPVICIGNLIAGGAGKTPLAIAIAERLAKRDLRPHFISRGYGGSEKGPHRVDIARDTAERVGDEPLLLGAWHPTWVGRDRVASARRAVAEGADVLILDDGFQNPALHKDLSLLAIDGGFGHGNGCVIPAGPLREPLARGFARADAAVIIGEGEPFVPQGIPCLHARLTPQFTGISLTGAPVLAFAGIGRPEKFFDTLRSLGAHLVETVAFPDHHPYGLAILNRLEMRAQSAGAMLVTTEKDAVRFPAAFRGRAMSLPVRMGFTDPEALDALLDTLMQGQNSKDATARA
ncbi:MAG: tetraacyldisaccharide 4'-kinase [Neomegalonema sp.]|nr:tetraacyldisaccharide 4'-kinase [Neomegalonema sp.]